MAGHSKWANIQHRKGRQDAKRAKVFTKLIREITVAARQGADLSANPALRLAVDKAYTQNMTKDVVERAIKRGSGTQDGGNYQRIMYEGYSLGGVAVLVECLTDNLNRTVSEVRHAFAKHGGNLGTSGSVVYLFDEIAQLVVGTTLLDGGVLTEDKALEIALDEGADDLIKDEFDQQTVMIIQAPKTQLHQLKQAFENHQATIHQAEIVYVSQTQVDCDDDTGEKLSRLIDVLEDLDDVQSVYHNAK